MRGVSGGAEANAALERAGFDGEAIARLLDELRNGGNKIYIAPSLGLVLTVMSSAYGRPYGQRRSQDILLRVLASVRA